MKKRRGIFQKTPGCKVFFIRFVDAQGKYRREKAGSFALAEKLLTKRRNEAQEGKKLPELRRRIVLFCEIADDALTYSRGHKLSFPDDCSRMALLVEWWGDREAESLTTSEIEKRLEDAATTKKWASSTYNHYRSLLMLAYREARRAGKVSVNPAGEVRHKREDNSRARFLTDAEEAKLRETIKGHWAEHLPEFELAVSTGLRKGSMYGLTWAMVDWNGRMLNIPTSKNGEPLHIPLNAAALAALRVVYQRGDGTGRVFQSAKTGGPLQNGRHWFDAAVKKAGVADFRWHDLRHTFASRLRMKGAKLADIGELLGHKSLVMTKRYAHLGPNHLHEVAALLDSNSTPVAPEPKPESGVPASYVN